MKGLPPEEKRHELHNQFYKQSSQKEMVNVLPLILVFIPVSTLYVNFTASPLLLLLFLLIAFGLIWISLSNAKKFFDWSLTGFVLFLLSIAITGAVWAVAFILSLYT